MANDTDVLEAALRRAMAVEDRPSLIVLRSHIGWPSPHMTDTAAAHGNPLGEDEVRETKEILGLPPDETFWVPDGGARPVPRCVRAGEELRRAWESRLARLAATGRRGTRPGPGGACRDGRRSSPPSRPARSIATRRAVNAA